MNWLDWLMIAMLASSAWGGFSEGFIRLGIGFLALIVGFVFASWFHGMAAVELLPYVGSKAVASVLGYLLIFIGVAILGSLLAALLARIFKLIGLSWMDRLLGGIFGLVRGALVLVIVAMVLTAFVPKRLPAAIHSSQLAPYVFGASRLLSELTPYEIRNRFQRSYADIKDALLRIKKEKKLKVALD